MSAERIDRRAIRRSLGSRVQRRLNTGMFPRMVGTGKVKPGNQMPSKVFKGKEHRQPKPRTLIALVVRAELKRQRGNS